MRTTFYPYSSDSSERLHFLAHAAWISILIVYLLHTGREALLKTYQIEIPWWIETPTYAAITWGLFASAIHHAWRWNWFRMLFRVKIPDLNGEWSGELESNYAIGRPIPCKLVI